MASNHVVVQIDDDDDEPVLLPPAIGTTKFNPISLEDDDDDIPIRKKRRFYKGECSNSSNVTFTCQICFDEKPDPDAFRVQGCSHSYCALCVSKYIAAKLQDNVTAITCPFSDCQGVFQPHQCRSILTKKVFDRWGDALCEAMIPGSQKFYCPFKDCSALMVNDGLETVVQSVCPTCNRLFCAACKVSWHAGIGCADFQKLKKDERGNEDIMLLNLAKSQKWKRCPRCGFYVSKISGCDAITCRCGHHFNYSARNNRGFQYGGGGHYYNGSQYGGGGHYYNGSQFGGGGYY